MALKPENDLKASVILPSSNHIPLRNAVLGRCIQLSITVLGRVKRFWVGSYQVHRHKVVGRCLIPNGEFHMLKKFLKDESGATAIEYVLIAAFMALILITVMPTLTTAIQSQFTSISSHITKGS